MSMTDRVGSGNVEKERELFLQTLCDVAADVDEAQQAVFPVFGVIDADAFCAEDLWLIGGVVEDEEVVAGQVEGVVFASDVKCAGEFTGAGEVGGPIVEGLGGAD